MVIACKHDMSHLIKLIAARTIAMAPYSAGQHNIRIIKAHIADIQDMLKEQLLKNKFGKPGRMCIKDCRQLVADNKALLCKIWPNKSDETVAQILK